VATGDLVFALDYNAIREKVISVIGQGYNQRGYGQPIHSSEASIGHTISEAVWNELRIDLWNIKLHQEGNQVTIPGPTTGQVIRYGANYPVTGYDTLIDDAIVSRFTIDATRSTITAKESETYNGTWSDTAQCTSVVQFDSVNNARYFFNSGGKIRFYSSFSANSPSPVNTVWTNLLDMAGTINFGASTPTQVTYYDLTDQYKIVHKEIAQGVYSSNCYYQILARCDVPNNELGTASAVYFRIEWVNDDMSGVYPPLYPPLYPGGSEVNGTLLMVVDELKATGPIFPSGTFTITSPIYTLSTITAS